MFDPRRRDDAARRARRAADAPAQAHARARLRERAALSARKFDAAGVKPDDLKTLADIARFPFTLKTDLRDNYPFGMFAVPRDKLLRLHASSGTTGKPTVVGYTKGDLDAVVAT